MLRNFFLMSSFHFVLTLSLVSLFEEELKPPDYGVLIPHASIQTHQCSEWNTRHLPPLHNLNIHDLFAGPTDKESIMRKLDKILDIVDEAKKILGDVDPNGYGPLFNKMMQLQLPKRLPGMDLAADDSDEGRKRALSQRPGVYLSQWLEDAATLLINVFQMRDYIESAGFLEHLGHRKATDKILLEIGIALRDILCDLLLAAKYHGQVIGDDVMSGVRERGSYWSVLKEREMSFNVAVILKSIRERILARKRLLEMDNYVLGLKLANSSRTVY